MDIIIHENNGFRIAEIRSAEIILRHVQDALDIIGSISGGRIRGIIPYQRNINPDFFRLHTGLAGEILQKFSNYMIRAAIVGNFKEYRSKSLHAFILESNMGNQIFFTETVDQAIGMLAGRKRTARTLPGHSGPQNR